MKRGFLIGIAVVVLLASSRMSCAAPLAAPLATTLAASEATSSGLVYVVFETEKGNITLEVDTRHAPITSAGFLQYVDAGQYTGGSFFRTTHRGPRGGIVIDQAEVAPGQEKFPAFKFESTAQTGITHTTGTLSMPRWDDPDTATSGISIMVGESHGLDNNPARGSRGLGYATFGHVYSGWDALHAIHESPGRGARAGGGRRGGRRGARGAAGTTGTQAMATPAGSPTPTPLPLDLTLTPPIKIFKGYRLPGPPAWAREEAK